MAEQFIAAGSEKHRSRKDESTSFREDVVSGQKIHIVKRTPPPSSFYMSTTLSLQKTNRLTIEQSIS